MMKKNQKQIFESTEFKEINEKDSPEYSREARTTRGRPELAVITQSKVLWPRSYHQTAMKKQKTDHFWLDTSIQITVKWIKIPLKIKWCCSDVISGPNNDSLNSCQWYRLQVVSWGNHITCWIVRDVWICLTFVLHYSKDQWLSSL